MQFSPIIHNLNPKSDGYAECQLYNNLINNRPIGDGSLASKLTKIKAWQNLCSEALEKAQQKLNPTTKG
ncbi:MAG: hypothetical protein IM606_09955 [Cytophagales bacterium]|nr:hypothetical protein [Cytophagales bacterium]